MKQQQRFFVADMTRKRLDLVIRMAVGNEEIHVTVVVIIKKIHGPSAHQPRQAAETHRPCLVVERKVMTVAVNGLHFLIHIRDEETLPTVLIKICRIRNHAGTLAAVLAIGHTRFEGSVLELSIVLIHEEEVGNRVVGDKQIHPAIIVDVRSDDTPGFSHRLGDA